MKKNVNCNHASAIFFIGMAGSGKTSLVYRLSKKLSLNQKNHYIINLDPASLVTPYSSNIDIRDTINYRKVMENYGLGPNGAIITCLNLFVTRFQQIKALLEIRKALINYILIDTPGQIEIFMWSASGSIICEAFSSNFPVMLIYTIDLLKSIHPLTFMSNILYSCSILYKTRLITLLALNKIDITSIDFVHDWISNADSFDSAFTRENFFAGSFTRSLFLTLDVYHQKTFYIGVSAYTGTGIHQILNCFENFKIEYELNFQIEFEKKILNNIQQLNFMLMENQQKDIEAFNNKNILKRQYNILCKDINADNNEYFNVLEYMIFLKTENDLVHTNKFLFCKN